MRSISDHARAVLKNYETGGYHEPGGKLRVLPQGQPALKCYIDDAGVPTIGWGHTGAGVKPGMKCTPDQAEAFLAADLAYAETFISHIAKAPTQGQFDGMALLAYNIGNSAFANSSVLRKHNAGDFDGAAASFGLWNKITQGGKKVVANGLTKRRAEEAAFYRGAR
jgi:lysozyme